MIRTYQYYAIFNFAEDGINVTFPDLPGCITCGDSVEEALLMAKEALELFLDGEPVEDIPPPQSIMPQLLKPKDKAYLIEANITYY
ncbi:putative RNase H-like HicB family nuclease [Paenibacillus sp. W4I10]|uniref:type II toxin-antitoxin system HicB family antitoxin n=1 Tax=Paenibacillus sp. W4I10 TaxID=3042298 RepID=UPI00278518A1|nr:type II toxin-antitoxin system HicB family antitoxin [Paenibacillus sp. W4I10]MDQ0724909.1 putative RNase H-like HicB family nuclease [Paenibacillus sp. W4I10]